jgi:hypothetical protein
MYNKNEKNYLSNGDLLDEKESIDEFEEVHQSKKSKFFEKIKYILKICSNSNAIMLIAIIELAFQGTCHILGSTSAKWHFLGWMIWFIIILSARIYFNGNLRVKKNI